MPIARVTNILAGVLCLGGLGPALGCAAGPGPTTAPAGPPAVINVPADQPTIQEAVDAAADGDTVLVAPGVYSGPIVLGPKAVTLASHFLTTGERKHIEQTVLQKESREGFVVKVRRTAGPGTRIVGFTIRNGSDGILCMARIHVLNNRITGCTDGIDYEGGGGVCRGNVFANNRDDGIDLDGDCDVLIEDNVVRDNRDDGIEIRLYEYKGKETLNIVIRNNLISGSREDGIQIIDHPGPSNRVLRIERNVIRDTAMAAIGCMDQTRTREDYRAAAIEDRIYLLNNTLLDNHYGLTGGGDLIALNNVFARTEKLAVKNAAGRSILAHNLFWKNGTDFADSNVDRNSCLFKDPLLDADGAPRPGSPCLDAGVAMFRRKGEQVLKMPPGSYAGAAPDLGARERAVGRKGAVRLVPAE